MSAADDLLLAALRGPAADRVRHRIQRQLVTSLVYEGAVVAARDGDDYVLPARDASGHPVDYRFRARRSLAFDRVRADPEPLRRHGPGGEVGDAGAIARLLDELGGSVLGGAYPSELARFAGELEETWVKDVLAEHVRHARGDVLAGAGHDRLEGLVTDGHRYHPAYKSRVGFDVADDVAHGPEFLPEVRPVWVAARRDVVEVRSSARLDGDPVRRELAAVADVFDERVRAAGGDPDDYAWLPVHPWQWERVITTAFAAELADGRLVPLGDDPHVFSALQSIRTLSCRDEPGRMQLKTALSITNTSTARDLAPHTVRNAAAVSDWLDRVVGRDEVLAERRVVLLGEVHGVSVVPGGPVLTRPRTEGRLGAIWRRPLPPCLDADEAAVPMTALTATELDGTPLVAPWLRAHGALPWVEALVDAVAVPLVHLLVRHGIALESHAQNVSVVHRDGWPARVVLRDFHDGVRFCRRLLDDPADAPVLDAPPAHHANANSFVETEDPALVTDFLLDAFFFVNLGELGLFLDDHGLVGESAFWGVVARRVREHQDIHGGAFDLFAPTLAVEKLTTRRLAPDTELRLHVVANPLHRFDPSRAGEPS